MKIRFVANTRPQRVSSLINSGAIDYLDFLDRQAHWGEPNFHAYNLLETSARELPHEPRNFSSFKIQPVDVEKYQVSNIASIISEDLTEQVTPAVVQQVSAPQKDTDPWTAPIQIFEGSVNALSEDGNIIEVTLTDKSGQLPDHTAEIAMQWIPEQDLELVKPGAVFYLMLYKETTRRTVRNFEEIRFRRLPNWTRSQIQAVNAEADLLQTSLVRREPVTDLTE